MPQRLLATLGAVAIAVTVASLGQGALMEATDRGVVNDATGARLTPAAESALAQESVAVLQTPQTATVRHARISPDLERQKREAMQRNVQAALAEVMLKKAAGRGALDATATATPDPTPEVTPTVEVTPEETAAARSAQEPTPEATATPTATPEPTPEATPTPETETLDATPTPEGESEGGDATHDFAYYLSEEFLRQYFGDNWQDASTVAACESSGNPDAVYADSDGHPLYVGLYQIYVGNWNGQYSADMLRDPDLNAQLAAELSNGGANWAENWPSCGAGL